MITCISKPAKFQKDFTDFDENRMYPLGYRKETTMQKLTICHVSAIARAEYFVSIAIEPNMNPFHRKQIEDDLTLLSQIKHSILRRIYEPGLPVQTEVQETSKIHGDTHPT